MNLGEAKIKAIQHINEYSTNGNLTSASQNADYTLRFNNHANDAQFEIAEKVGIEASYKFTQVGSNVEGYTKYPLPADFRQFIKLNKDDEPFYSYRIENRQIIIKNWIDGSFELLYYKNPTVIDDTTQDDYSFEIDAQYHHLIPYYMGGMAVIDENQALSNKLLNIYYGKLNNATKMLEDFPTKIQNIYSFQG